MVWEAATRQRTAKAGLATAGANETLASANPKPSTVNLLCTQCDHVACGVDELAVCTDATDGDVAYVGIHIDGSRRWLYHGRPKTLGEQHPICEQKAHWASRSCCALGSVCVRRQGT